VISVAVDWGSSTFRAYRFDSSGKHIDSINSACGIKFVKGRRFEATLREHIGNWVSPGDTVLLSGMITSRNGWMESDYIACPASLHDIATHGKHLQLTDLKLIFLPGVNQSNPPDVMRGEELQLLGATFAREQKIFVIAGTHSKWALVANGTIDRFRTIPTGELFDLIVRQSLVGALTEEGTENDIAFREGIESGFESTTIISDLFTTRSSVLMGQHSGGAAYHWLSGLLIGNEIREGRNMMPETTLPIVLIGSDRLCEKYSKAFELLGIAAELSGPDVTIQGFQQLIQNNQS